MAKFHGNVGFVTAEETSPGVHTQNVVERHYRGDILQNSRRWREGEKLNDDLTINNRFSILADPYAHTNMRYIRYIEWEGTKWEVSSVDIRRPRLIIHVGGVYNG
jgi:hypothetical protein